MLGPQAGPGEQSRGSAKLSKGNFRHGESRVVQLRPEHARVHLVVIINTTMFTAVVSADLLYECMVLLASTD